MSAAPDSENTQPADDRETTDAPAEQLIPAPGEAGDTGLVADSEASGDDGAAVPAAPTFAEQDAAKRPGDGPDALD